MPPPTPPISTEISSPTQIDNSKASIESYEGVARATSLQTLEEAKHQLCDVIPLLISITTQQDAGKVHGFLHLPHGYTQQRNRDHITTGAILLSGAGGGVVGPSSIYLSLAEKLASLRRGIPVLRLDYRFPARIQPCCEDVVAAMQLLQRQYHIHKFVLVGWSFGSAPVFTVAASEPSTIVGCATIAAQTAQTGGIRALSPRPLLLLHGTGDKTLSQRCSEQLYDAYGKKGDRRIHLFDLDNHALTNNSARAEEMLCDFIAKCAGYTIDEHEQMTIIRQPVIKETAKVQLMEKGGDLRGDESVA